MLSALVLATLVRYDFSPSMRASFDVKVGFDGYLPLLGGQQAKVDVSMGVGVGGLAPDSDGRTQVSSEIKEFKVVLNGTAFPFTAKNVAEFFPKTTVSVSPEGKVLKSDAPDKPLPVRLPGLDAKRFPDITYVPVELPADGIEEGKPFKFSKTFGGSPVDYVVTPRSIKDDAVDLDVELSQKLTEFEDARGNPAKEAEATNRVETTLTGKGTATFDRRRGLVRLAHVVAESLGKVTDLVSKAQSERKLKTELTIELRKGA